MSEAEAERVRARLRLQTGTLTIRVRGPDGEDVPGAEVGWAHLGEERWFLAGEGGSRVLTQIPHGRVTARARSERYRLEETEVEVLRGIPAEVTLILKIPKRPR